MIMIVMSIVMVLLVLRRVPPSGPFNVEDAEMSQASDPRAISEVSFDDTLEGYPSQSSSSAASNPKCGFKKSKKSDGVPGHLPGGVASAVRRAVSQVSAKIIIGILSVMATSSLFVMALSILSLNCNGIRDQSKRNGLVQWLRSLPVSVDVFCLQKTHCVSCKDCSSWFLSSDFGFLLSPGSSHSCGNIVLFRPSLSLVDFWCDVDGRFLQCEFSYLGKSFRICYCPNCNPARDQFVDRLHPKIDPSVLTFLVGDFKVSWWVD